jgi:hypothetical protein
MCSLNIRKKNESDDAAVNTCVSIIAGCKDTGGPCKDFQPSDSQIDFLAKSGICDEPLNKSCPSADLPGCPYFGSSSVRHGRAILAMGQAQDIFRYRSISFAKERDKAGILAGMYGVSVKTIRDIWVGRTWYRATFHLDPIRPFTPERLQKRAGRPKGAKDSVPRARKHTLGTRSLNFQPPPFFCSTSSSEGPQNDTCIPPIQPIQPEAQDAAAGREPSVGSERALLQGRGVDPDSESRWLDFPKRMPAAVFEDPFHDDWSRW